MAHERLEVKRAGGTVIVRFLDTHIDAERADSFQNELCSLARHPDTLRIVLDFVNAQEIAAGMIPTLFEVYKARRVSDSKIICCNLQEDLVAAWKKAEMETILQFPEGKLADFLGKDLIKTELVGDVTVVTFILLKLLEKSCLQRIGIALLSLADDARRKLLLDFTGVEYMSSSIFDVGTGYLIPLWKKMGDRRANLRLCCIIPEIYEVFSITRLNQAFRIRQTREDALKSLATQTHIEVHQVGDVTAVTFLDSEIVERDVVRIVGDEIFALVETDAPKIVLWFVGVEKVAAGMWGKVSALQEKVTAVQGQLRLCGISGDGLDVLHVTELDQHLLIKRDWEEALESLRG